MQTEETASDAIVDGDAVLDAPEEADPSELSSQPAEMLVPKGHQILISVEGQVGSKISQAKDFFPIRLAAPVVINDVEVLPAGLVGEGQVIHAAKGGFAGSAGELLLAARYLMHGDRRIDLRSFKFIAEGDEIPVKGKDNSDAVIATAAILGPVGFLIGGGNTTIEPGTVATAKFRNDEVFEVGAGASAAADKEIAAGEDRSEVDGEADDGEASIEAID